MYVQGQPWLSEQSKSALTDRNMHAKTFLKMILEFCDFYILGTTTSFYEMPTVRPLLDQMLATLSVKNKIIFFFHILLNFSFESEPM